MERTMECTMVMVSRVASKEEEGITKKRSIKIRECVCRRQDGNIEKKRKKGREKKRGARKERREGKGEARGGRG